MLIRVGLVALIVMELLRNYPEKNISPTVARGIKFYVVQVLVT